MTTLACDVSEWQCAVSNSYPHDVLACRIDTGWRLDTKIAANWKWAKKALASGRLKVFIGYVVYIPGQNAKVLSRVKSVLGSACPDGVALMVDLESGSDFAGPGNHSAEANALAQSLATYAGSRKRVIGYANGNDWANNWPTRPAWMRCVVASYGAQQPSMHNMIGWQYSDGATKWPVPAGLPRSSKPFGACDHNVFPGLTPAQLATTLGLGDDMALTAAEIKQIWDYPITYTDPLTGKPNKQPAWKFVAAGWAQSKASSSRIAKVQSGVTAVQKSVASVTGQFDAAAIAADIKAKLLALLNGK